MVFRLQLNERLNNYIRSSAGTYFFVIVLMVIGIVFGASAVKSLGPDQKAELANLLHGFITGLPGELQGVNWTVLMRDALLSNMKTAGLLLILGLTVIGIPLTIVIIFVRGFIMGFTVGFLVEELGSKGLVLALLSVFPPNLFSVPAFLIMAVTSFSLSLTIVKNRLARRNISISPEFPAYTAATLVVLVLLVISSFIEGFVNPIVLKVFSAYLGQGFGKLI